MAGVDSRSGLAKMIFCRAPTISMYLGTNSYLFSAMTAHMHNAFADNLHSLIARATINVTTLLKVLAQLAMVLSACVVSSGAVHAADSPELERMAHQLAQTTCAYCHGVSGNSISPMFPNLSAQTAPYLQAQLRAFRDQSRADPDAQALHVGTPWRTGLAMRRSTPSRTIMPRNQYRGPSPGMKSS